MLKQANNSKITALYERLSKDDEQKNESVSIAHQKQMLEEYATHAILRMMGQLTRDCTMLSLTYHHH